MAPTVVVSSARAEAALLDIAHTELLIVRSGWTGLRGAGASWAVVALGAEHAVVEGEVTRRFLVALLVADVAGRARLAAVGRLGRERARWARGALVHESSSRVVGHEEAGPAVDWELAADGTCLFR